MKFQSQSLLLLILVFASACAQVIGFRGTPNVPAATAEAKVSRDRNNNAVIKVEVSHLAPPENLNPPKKVYVVWAQAPEGRTINLGQLVVGSNRTGKFNGVTPLKEFRLIITAEDIPAVAAPSEPILSTEVFIVKG